MEASCHYSQMANFLTACVRLDVHFVLNVVVLMIAVVPFVFDSRPQPGVFLLWVPNAELLFPPAFWV